MVALGGRSLAGAALHVTCGVPGFASSSVGGVGRGTECEELSQVTSLTLVTPEVNGEKWPCRPGHVWGGCPWRVPVASGWRALCSRLCVGSPGRGTVSGEIRSN